MIGSDFQLINITLNTFTLTPLTEEQDKWVFVSILNQLALYKTLIKN